MKKREEFSFREELDGESFREELEGDSFREELEGVSCPIGTPRSKEGAKRKIPRSKSKFKLEEQISSTVSSI